MEVSLVHFGQEPLERILNWRSGQRRWMSASDVAPVKGGGCSWAAEHQLLSGAADYVGHGEGVLMLLLYYVLSIVVFTLPSSSIFIAIEEKTDAEKR